MNDNETPQSNKFLNRPLIIPSVVVLVLLFMVGSLYLLSNQNSNSIVTQKNTSPSPVATPVPTSTAQVPSISLPSPQLYPHNVVLNSLDNDKLTYYYFDKEKHQITIKNAINAPDGLAGGSIGDNTKVQYASNGDSYYRTSTGGGMGGPDDLPLASKIYKYPNTLIVDDKKAGGLFDGWLLTKDGSKIYLARAAESDEPNPSRDLMVIDTKTLQVDKVATIGPIDSPLVMNSDETKILAVAEHRMIKNGQTFAGDYYVKIITLADKSVQENLLWKLKNPSPFPFFSSSSLSFGPSLLKAVGAYRQSDKTTLRTIDVNDTKENDIYTMQGKGKSDHIYWSPDGMKIILEVNAFDNVPSDQGIVLYDFNTGKSTQLVTANESVVNGIHKGEVRLIEGSYDGKSFLYSINRSDTEPKNDIYFYDIENKKQYKTASSVGEILAGYSFK